MKDGKQCVFLNTWMVTKNSFVQLLPDITLTKLIYWASLISYFRMLLECNSVLTASVFSSLGKSVLQKKHFPEQLH